MAPCSEPRRFSLTWKLTGFFLLFGLSLSYFTFLAFGGVSSRIVLRAAAGMAGAAFEAAFPDRGAGFADSLDGAPNRGLTDFLAHLPFVDRGGLLGEFRLFSRIPGGEWMSYTEGTEGSLLAVPARGRIVALLEESEAGRASLTPKAVALKSAAVPALLGLPPGSDGTEWALGAQVNVSGLADFLKENGKETAFYLIGLFLLAIALGHTFAHRFTKPIKQLASAAADYGKDAADHSFDSRRRDEIGVLSRTLDGMTREIEKRRLETEERLRAMEAMNRIDKAVLSTTSRSELLERVAGIINGFLAADAVAVALRNQERTGWVIAALTGSAVRLEASSASDARFLPVVNDDLIDSETSLRMTGYYEGSISTAPSGFVFFSYDVMGLPEGRIVAAPLYVDGRFLGSLLFTLARDEPLTAEFRRTVSMLADQMAVALRSILEHEAKEENFLGILQALTRAIDAKSRWTAGHSERVAETAVKLGMKLQMSEGELRSLRIAAILHDAGKLGVREAVLDKPGKLEPAEYEEIKQHPSLGGKILAGIRSFEGIIPAIVHHHERWDGTGYPDGLSGEDIPLASRIITVADVWDAIIDDRPYRAGLAPGEARRFMVEHEGKLFDPRLVRLFLE